MRDSVIVHFRVNKSKLDLGFRNNRARLDSLVNAMGHASIRQVKRITVAGGASPEGSIALNDRLSRKRAKSFIDYLDDHVAIPDSIVHFSILGRDWLGLYKKVLADPKVPHKDQVMPILEEIMSHRDSISDADDRRYLRKLATVAGGKSYSYIYNNIFPALRKSLFIVEYRKPYSLPKLPDLLTNNEIAVSAPTPVAGVIPVPEFEVVTDFVMTEEKPFYMALKTNMLYDALAVPNLYAEFYVGKNWSIAGGGMYAWWSYDPRHKYWRVYGGDITVRRWLGKAAEEKPLTGHHLGINAGALTFDYEWGGVGYMGGKPKGTLLDRCLFTAGIEYGYSLPITRRLNIDFSLTLGYLGGKYIKYFPYEDYYVRDSEYKINYFGPTKAEISLVWLLGHGNVNQRKAKKGGGR